MKTRRKPPSERGRWGKDFERELEKVHHYYLIHNIGCITKNPREWEFAAKSRHAKLSFRKAGLTAVTDNGRFLVSKPSKADFEGNIGPWFIAFDAKSTASTNVPLDKTGLKPHQVKRLADHERTGAVAGFMIRFSKYERIFFVSARVAEEAQINMVFKRGPKSVNVKFCEKHGTEIPVENGLIGWAEALGLWGEE